MKALSIVVFAITLLTGCSEAATDWQGRELPKIGATAHASGLVVVTEEAMRALTTLSPDERTKAAAPEGIKNVSADHLKQATERLIKAGKAFNVANRTKIRVLQYLDHDRLPVKGGQVGFAKIQILEGPDNGRHGFIPADAFD